MGVEFQLINQLFKNVEIEPNKIIIVHAKIKGISDLYPDLSYKYITKSIIKYLSKKYNPKTILIPCYSYSFTKSGVFHMKYSKSEVGRFSEEARMLGYHRTPDPIFSFLDTHKYLERKKINYSKVFTKDCIFNFMHNNNAIILNVGLNRFIATHRHYVEYCFNVDYRFHKYFNGIIYYNKIKSKKVKYDYYVRDLNKQSNGNLHKITKDLLNQKYLNQNELKGIKIRWINCSDYLDFFKSKMKINSHYMIE